MKELMEKEGQTIKDKAKSAQKNRDYNLDVDKYILVHVDGRSFSRMVKNKFKKPFDEDFIRMMNETAIFLCENVQGAKVAYVQSDEISLLLKKDSPEGDIFFGGRLCKMQSIIASLATAKFNQLMTVYSLKKTAEYYEDNLYAMSFIDEEITEMPLYQFDCKVWDVDTANDALAWFLFRNIDCVKNSKQQAAQTWLSHKELLNKQTDEQIALLKDVYGVDWYDFPQSQKYGRVIDKTTVEAKREMPNGEIIKYNRSKWVANPGVDLTNAELRDEFINNHEYFKN